MAGRSKGDAAPRGRRYELSDEGFERLAPLRESLNSLSRFDFGKLAGLKTAHASPPPTPARASRRTSPRRKA